MFTCLCPPLPPLLIRLLSLSLPPFFHLGRWKRARNVACVLPYGQLTHSLPFPFPPIPSPPSLPPALFRLPQQQREEQLLAASPNTTTRSSPHTRRRPAHTRAQQLT